MQIFVRNLIRNATFNQYIEQKCTQYNYYATFICSQYRTITGPSSENGLTTTQERPS